MNRQGGDPRQLPDALQVVIVVHDRIVDVDVPATGQVDLLAAVDDLSISVIGSCFAIVDLALGVAVEGDLQACIPGHLQDARQEPGVTPGGQDQVRVVALEDSPQRHQKGAGRLEVQGEAGLCRLNPDFAWFGVERIALRLQGQHVQWRMDGVNIPGGTQHLDIVNAVQHIDLHFAIGERVGSMAGGITQ